MSRYNILLKNVTSILKRKLLHSPKQLLFVDFVRFSYVREIFPIQGHLRCTAHFSGLNRLDA